MFTSHSENKVLNTQEVSVKKDATNSETTITEGSSKSHGLGRRGDPRMHRAVNARLANPSISLLEALIIGGFEFPNGTDARNGTGSDAHGKSTRNIYDSDNVLLSQRKNQLSRRLRLARRRSERKQKAGPCTEKETHLNQSENESSVSLLASTKMSALQTNCAMKRGCSGPNLDEHIAATRLKLSNDYTCANLETRFSLNMTKDQPQSPLLALLQQHQQQRALQEVEQTQANTPSFFPPPIVRHQGLEDLYLQNQVSINDFDESGVLFNRTHQSDNGNHFQNITQNSLDQYDCLKKLTANSRTTELSPQESMLYHQNLSQIELLQQSGLLKNIHRNTNQFEDETAATRTHLSRNLLNLSQTIQQGNIQTLKRTVDDLERRVLMERCLRLLAGQI